jgi:hypothetical protein
MKKMYILLVCALLIPSIAFVQIDLKYQDNKTLTYYETIKAYQHLDSISQICKLIEYGKTDIGKPLHVFVISKSKDFDPISIRNNNKRIILVNNGIHPGESCGVDASVQLALDIVEGKYDLNQYLDNVVLCIIPIYNIGGALNRSCCSRANQNGPEEKGFRGNAKYLDLNRDFIKCDTRNAKVFTEIFHTWKPDVFIDTHTSDGADYQYVITLLSTLHSKMQADLGEFFKMDMNLWLFERMEEYDYEMTPYVEWNNRRPENGLLASFDPPRFASGYAALFNTLSFTTEAHMFKPFKERVLGTYYFLRSTLEYTSLNAEKIRQVREKAMQYDLSATEFPLKWSVDSSVFDMFYFKGYESEYFTSKITGEQLLSYNRQKPWTELVRYYAYYKADLLVQKPTYYIIPQAWEEVIQRLKLNQVEMKQLVKDTTIAVNAYYINNYNKSQRSYYWHHPISDVEISIKNEEVQLYQGDYVIETNQDKNRFIVSVLEPQFDDSYFSWNFFQSVLNQKEWFSPYVFEDYALKMLDESPDLKKEFEERKLTDKQFAGNSWAQMYFIYQHSEFMEPYLNRYPVFRIEEKMDLPVE